MACRRPGSPGLGRDGVTPPKGQWGRAPFCMLACVKHQEIPNRPAPGLRLEGLLLEADCRFLGRIWEQRPMLGTQTQGCGLGQGDKFKARRKPWRKGDVANSQADLPSAHVLGPRPH